MQTKENLNVLQYINGVLTVITGPLVPRYSEVTLIKH